MREIWRDSEGERKRGGGRWSEAKREGGREEGEGRLRETERRRTGRRREGEHGKGREGRTRETGREGGRERSYMDGRTKRREVPPIYSVLPRFSKGQGAI